MRTAVTTNRQLVAAVLIAAAHVSVVALAAISTVEWPAFPSSNQLHASPPSTGRLLFWSRRDRLAVALDDPVRQHSSSRASLPAQVPSRRNGDVRMPWAPRSSLVQHLGGSAIPHRIPGQLADSPPSRDMTYAGMPSLPAGAGSGWRPGPALSATPTWEMFETAGCHSMATVAAGFSCCGRRWSGSSNALATAATAAVKFSPTVRRNPTAPSSPC